MFRKTISLLLLAPWLLLGACDTAGLPDSSRPTEPDAAPATSATIAAATAPVQTAAIPRAAARSADQMNTTTPQQRAEAAKPATSPEVRLGSTVASLGDPTLPGFWVKTPLVKAPAKGRVHYAITGKSAKVDLLPLAGPASGGSQLSLPALQLLGVSLTDLPTVEIWRN